VKVQGTEPVVLTKVVDMAARREVRDTQRSTIDMNLDARRDATGARQEIAVPQEARSYDEAIARINATMVALNVRLKFEKHESSGEYLVRVINEESNEVIREIPPERTLDMVAHLQRLIGLILDERV
jgi:flagellar protein FlaG